MPRYVFVNKRLDKERRNNGKRQEFERRTAGGAGRRPQAGADARGEREASRSGLFDVEVRAAMVREDAEDGGGVSEDAEPS